MRTLDDGTLALSPSDLSAHLACAHLTTLSLAVARGELEQPHVDSPHRDLIFRKGNEHEDAYLARLEAEGRSILRVPTLDDEDFDPVVARRLTEEAIRAREADVIYQPYLTDGRWRGFADFLEKHSGGGYEPVDTKLARTAKPSHVLQLCFYAEQLARIQGAPVEHIHVENGRGERETFRVAEFESYYRRVRERFLAALDAKNETYPWPCDHCGICDFRAALLRAARRGRSPDARRGRLARTRRVPQAAGIETLEALGEVIPGTPVDGLRPETVEAMRHQAELQLRARARGAAVWEPLPVEEERGFSLLPAPTRETCGSTWRATPSTRRAEGSNTSSASATATTPAPSSTTPCGRATATGSDGPSRRSSTGLSSDAGGIPGMHVYHYAHYERTALTPADGRARHARGGDRRRSSAARCSSTSTA